MCDFMTKMKEEVKGLQVTGGLAQWRQLSRRQYCGKLHVILPQQVQWKPPLRQAAGTLGAMRGQRIENRKN